MLASEAAIVGEWAAAAGIEPNELAITGYVSDADLGALYHACELFVFASIYEGSGLPILEAMSCGAPVVASNTSTADEILGDLEGTFDPYDPGAIAAAIEETLRSETVLAALAERSRRRVSQFTWDRVADRSIEAYQDLLTPRRRHRRARRPRIALVTPWPPQRSGIADYNLRLARDLGAKADVDVVVDGSLDDYAPPLERGVRLVTAETFRSAEAMLQPDRVLYCMGNSSFHRHVYELLRERPGALVAHDVRLTGFYGWFSGIEHPADPKARLAERLKALYGLRLPRAVTTGDEPVDWRLQSSLGLYMTREIQQYAEEIFVHSHYALEVLQLDRGVLDRAVPVSVIPFGTPAADAARAAQPDPGDHPLVVSVGVLSEVKGLAELIAAAALVAEQYPALRLVLAGPAEEVELNRWRAVARELAPEVQIEVPGHLAPADYAGLLRDADLAVQLRTLSNGEASAAVADCLGAGTPTLATGIGWAAELPRDAIATVPPGASVTVLAERMQALLDEPAARERLSEGALEYARETCFAQVADAYLDALDLG